MKSPIDRLVAKASEFSGIDAKSIKTRCRFEHIFRIRHCVWFVATEHPESEGRLHRSFSNVARVFGYDHTSVAHGARRAAARLAKPEHDLVVLVEILRREWREANGRMEDTVGRTATPDSEDPEQRERDGALAGADA